MMYTWHLLSIIVCELVFLKLWVVTIPGLLALDVNLWLNALLYWKAAIHVRIKSIIMNTCIILASKERAFRRNVWWSYKIIIITIIHIFSFKIQFIKVILATSHPINSFKFMSACCLICILNVRILTGFIVISNTAEIILIIHASIAW
jgi:hypothetical protein